MGFNTNITICNDYLADYERNPERFARIICGGALKPYGDGYPSWGITVLQADHADGTQLVAVGGNTATKVYTGHTPDLWPHHTRIAQVALLRRWADSLGFRIVDSLGFRIVKGGAQ